MSGMNKPQQLYPQLIYRINEKIPELLLMLSESRAIEGKSKTDIFVAPSIFNPHARNFHWLMVAKERWELTGKDLKKIKKFITETKQNNLSSKKKKPWDDFKEKYPSLKTIEDTFKDLESSDDPGEYHHALLMALQFYPVKSNKYIDGIIYRNLARQAKERKNKSSSTHKIDYAVAELLIDDKKTFKLYPWAKVDFFFCSSSKKTRYSCQENNHPWYPKVSDMKTKSIPPLKSEHHYSKSRPKEYADKKKFPLTPANKINDSFYHNYFLPLFTGNKRFKFDNFLKLESADFSKFQHLVIIPLYDAYIEGNYYGNLCGTLQIPFKTEDSRKTFINSERHKKLISNSHLITSEIKEAAIFELLQQTIEKDLLEHFIKYVTLVQDWERIMAWEYDNKENNTAPRLHYCYTRDEDSKWVRCEPENSGKCNGCKPNLDKLKEWIKQLKEKHLPISEGNYGNKNAKRKTVLENIFSRKLIPELYPEDEKKYKNTHLIFEYPCYTVFPDNEKDNHKLGLYYERQQIDILRQIALQLRIKTETQKHGTKAAMTAIMARNISHNIGSHVISYWNTELQERLKSAESTPDKRYFKEKQIVGYSEGEAMIKTSKELFQYIQHRQDFVAELATSIPSSEMSLDLGNDIFNPFIAPIEEKYGETVSMDSNLEKCISAMLGYIAKSEHINMHGKIELITGDLTNTMASIPNGLVGVHAVYSILENFIRNAAKHCKGVIQNGKRMIRIEVKEPDNSNWKEDYLAVTIWDWRENSCEKKTIEAYKKFLPGGGEESAFSNADGSLKPGGWGIKEMLTSANFLRKKTPEDLYKYINNPEYITEPPLLEALCDNHANCKGKKCARNKYEGEYKGKFGIRFYLRKPKDLAVVINNNEKTCFTFGDNGLAKNSNFAIKRFNNYREHIKDISSYNMVLVKKEDAEKNKLSNKPALPCRIKPFTNSKNGKDNNEKYLELYEEFIKETFELGNNNLPLPYYAEWNADKLKRYFDYNDNAENGKFLGHLSDPKNVRQGVESLLHGKYIQPVSGGYSTKAKLTTIDNIEDDYIYRQVFLELAEAVFVKILIVDERISDWAKKEFTRFKAANGDGKKFNALKKNNDYYVLYNKDILKGMKIYVIDIDKENISWDSLRSKLTDWLKLKEYNKAKKNGEKLNLADFFVIHQGVLDKLNDKDNGNKNYDKKLMESINCRWQVIDSGRGVPEKEKLTRYSKARFVQISALQKLLENFDKHGLVQTLFSARRPLIEEEKWD